MNDDRGEPLREVFARLIAATGPISVAHYMAESNARYYAARDPLGAAGDFVTAPEISQMFGELIGLWLADVWTRAGRPQPVHYVELGPGRGTLARDALGAMARFGLTPQVHLVETSPALREVQRALLPQATWHDDVSTVPERGALLVVGNEFLDALPVRQLVRTAAGWRERMVGLADGALAFIAGDRPIDAAEVPDLPEGAIIETCPAAAAVVAELARRLAEQGGAALLIDYGHAEPRGGSTLQAVRAHRKLDVLAAPGAADLTAHVDFATLAQVAQANGARWLGTVEQGAFLRALGIDARAAALAGAAPAQADAIAAARARLVGDDAMGSLFKVMALLKPEWPEGAGFAAPRQGRKCCWQAERPCLSGPPSGGPRPCGAIFPGRQGGNPDRRREQRRGRRPSHGGQAQRQGFRMAQQASSDAPVPQVEDGAADGYRRRDFINVGAVAFAGIGGVCALYPLISQMAPSADVLAESSTEIDISSIKPGMAIKAVWRKQPVFIRNLTPAEIAAADKVDVGSLRDPQTLAERTKEGKKNWLITMGVCTHLGCVPLGAGEGETKGEFGGYFCPCHGSVYDTAARIRKGPAPKNLEVPEYAFNSDTVVKIG